MANKPQPRPAKMSSKGVAKPMPKPAKIKQIGKAATKKSPSVAKAAFDEKRRENYNAMRGTGKGMKNTLMRIGGMPAKAKKK